MASQPTPISSTWRATKSQIGTLCQRYGPLIQNLPADLEGVQLMYAFACRESIHEPGGVLWFPPRHEPGYDVGGRYCNPDNPRDREQVQLVGMYGSDAARSYGPWQVMFLNAKGFKPSEMQDLEKCAQVFLGFVNRELAEQKPETLEEIGKMYNHGNWRDKYDDHAYTDLLKQYYFTEVLG